ncbi:MAG TPA: FAD-dependent oxidoreductase, partial [Lacipirellulaceae bacterium]|nr:FAD-dependent oxidoreductase [Lacipirellulaceae bacterium]
MTPHVRLGGRRSAAHRTRPRVAVVGAGIVGLAHAWAAARRGWQVLLFDRNPRAIGASIRNFGMVWPIGQPNGPLHRTALRSRQLWGELLRDADCWSAECGSLHLAYREDELAVLQEFVRMGPALGYPCELLDAEEVLRRSPAARPDGLLGGLWSATELCVDPREVMERGPHWLHRAYGVELHFGVPIVQTGRHSVVSADQRRWVVDQVVVAAGADLRLLDPELYA